MTVVTRSSGDPSSLAPLVEEKIWTVDPDQAVYRSMAMGERLDDLVAQPRFYAALITLFALTALVLASVGLYGVISYSVSQRTREIGIRMALGAQRQDVLGLILKSGLVWWWPASERASWAPSPLTRLVRNLLFGVSPTDPVTFLWVPILLAAVALLACYLPARRAAALAPLLALRES